MTNSLEKVKEALVQFIIRTSEKEAPDYAVQALPEVVKALIELTVITRVRS